MSAETFIITPQMEKMFAAIERVNPGRYGMKIVEIDAIAHNRNFELFVVAQDAFNLGFSRGQQRIKRLMARNEHERSENALRELLDRFSILPDERKAAVLEVIAEAITMTTKCAQ